MLIIFILFAYEIGNILSMRIPDFDLCARIQGPGRSEIFWFHAIHISNHFTLSSENRKRHKKRYYVCNIYIYMYIILLSLIFHDYSTRTSIGDDTRRKC